MKMHSWMRRGITGLLVATLAFGTLAPAAHAADWGRVRYKGDGGYAPRQVNRYPSGTYIVRRSSAGPIIAGFLGGLFLGVTLANAAPAGYAYYDPYCHESFASLSIYNQHLRRYHHPQYVRVVSDDDPCLRDRGYGYDNGWDGRNWDRREGSYGRDDQCNRGDRYNQDWRTRERDDRQWDGRNDRNWNDRNSNDRDWRDRRDRDDRNDQGENDDEN